MKGHLTFVVMLGATGCSQPVEQGSTSKAVSAIMAEALKACEGKSAALNEEPSKPETYTRSEHDQCMAALANKTKPANAEICKAANGDLVNEGKPTAECLLVIA